MSTIFENYDDFFAAAFSEGEERLILSSVMTESLKLPLPAVAREIPSSAMTNSVAGQPSPSSVYIDLVFYHRRLRCHVLVELKVRAFQHGDAGQMNFYLNYWKTKEVEEGDSPPVGLLLCSGKDATKVEYATAGMDRELFVSRYLVALPSPEQLRGLIEADRAALELRAALKAADAQENP